MNAATDLRSMVSALQRDPATYAAPAVKRRADAFVLPLPEIARAQIVPGLQHESGSKVGVYLIGAVALLVLAALVRSR